MAAQEAPAVNPPSSQLLLVVLSVVFMGITAVAVGFRLYTRISVSKKLFTEDVFIVAGTIFAFGLSSCYTTGAFHGYGQQLSQIIAHPGNLDLVYKISFIVTYLYTAANYLVKMSFLALYYRLDSRKPMRYAVYALIFVESAQAIATIIVTSLSWAPLSARFKGKTPLVSGMEVQDFYNANGIITAITSAAIYVAPILMVHTLDIPWRQKLAVKALFSLGFLSTAATCLKTYYSWDLVTSPDVFSKITTACLWIQVEVHAAIICGSAQTFRVLLKGFCPACYRSPDEESSHRSHTIPEFPQPPHYSPATLDSGASMTSLPSPQSIHSGSSTPVLEPPRPYHNSWKDWEVSTGEVSRTPTPSSARDRPVTPRMVEFRAPSRSSATMPPGVQQNYPSIASRIDGGEGGVHNVWVYEATTPNKRDSSHWPLA